VSPYADAKLMAGVVPPEDTTGLVPVTEVTPPGEPLAAAVIKPLALTVMLAFVNAPTLLLTVARVVALPTDVTSPFKLALVVTLLAVNAVAVPVMFVPTMLVGVPKTAPLPSVVMPDTFKVVLAVIAFAANVVLATVNVPVAAPTLSAVAAPKALTVVAPVFNKAIVADVVEIVAPLTASVLAKVAAPLMVVSGVIVTAPVLTEPIPMVPLPFAFTVRLVFAPLSVTTTATVPSVAAPVTLSPATCDAVDESTVNAGLVAPVSPTANAEAEDEVTAAEVLALRTVNAPVLGVVPPIAPGTGNDVTLAVPSKLVPPIVLAVAKAVAVDALPTKDPVKVVALTVVKAPVLGLEAPIGVLFIVLSVIAKA